MQESLRKAREKDAMLEATQEQALSTIRSFFEQSLLEEAQERASALEQQLAQQTQLLERQGQEKVGTRRVCICKVHTDQRSGHLLPDIRQYAIAIQAPDKCTAVIEVFKAGQLACCSYVVLLTHCPDLLVLGLHI